MVIWLRERKNWEGEGVRDGKFIAFKVGRNVLEEAESEVQEG